MPVTIFCITEPKTDFESIGVDIRNGSSIKLNWFIHKINAWLNNAKHAYEDLLASAIKLLGILQIGLR